MSRFYKRRCCCRGTARCVLSLVTTKVTFNLTQGHLYYSRCWIGHTSYMIFISLPLQLCLYLAPFSRYYRLFSKISRGHVTLTTPTRGRWSSQDARSCTRNLQMIKKQRQTTQTTKQQIVNSQQTSRPITSLNFGHMSASFLRRIELCSI